MNNPPHDAPSQKPSKEAKEKKRPNPVPATLTEFLLADKSSATAFVRALSKRPALLDDDLNRAHLVMDREPGKVGMVVELARAAATAAPQPDTLLRWCEEVIRSRDEALRDWALDPARNAQDALTALVEWANPLIRGRGEAERRWRAESTLLIGLAVLFARRGLAPLDALRTLERIIWTQSDGRGSASLERSTRKQLLRASAKQLAGFAKVVALSEREIASSEDARASAVALVAALRLEKEALEEEQAALSARERSLVQELDQRVHQIEELRADVEGAKVRGLQDLEVLRARFRREIGERLDGLLADAWDALDTNPPHPGVARERLENARDAIRREVEWLNKS